MAACPHWWVFPHFLPKPIEYGFRVSHFEWGAVSELALAWGLACCSLASGAARTMAAKRDRKIGSAMEPHSLFATAVGSG